MATINDLILAISSRNTELDCIDDDIDLVNKRFDSFRKYFNAVYEHVIGSSTLLTMVHGGRIDVEKYQYQVSEYDNNRRMVHEAAIASCNIINRMCDLHNIDHLCPEAIIENGKCMNRGEIADFVGRYMYKVFQQGRIGQELAPIAIDEFIKYGDGQLLDTTIEIAKGSNLNPECAYKQEDISKEAYEDFDGFDFTED